MLRVQLLGGFRVALDDMELEPPVSQRAASLFAWFAFHPGLHARSAVAATFWPDLVDSSAHASLRTTLWTLRASFGRAIEDYLDIGRDQIGLRPGAPVSVDLNEFADRVDAGQWAEAADLGSTGELLPGYEDEWVIDARNEHRAQMVQVREHLVPSTQDAERVDVELDLAEIPPERAALPPTAAAPWPLVGREQDLARLVAAWQSVRRGPAAAVVVTGDPGIGKSRLVTELQQQAERLGDHSASCTAMTLAGAAPLSVLAELIGELTMSTGLPPDDATWPAALAPLAPDLAAQGEPRARASGSPPSLERARVFEGTVSLLTWASRRPLVLVFEDVHAADAASLELIAYICRRAARLPMLVVLTRRPLPPRAQVDELVTALRARQCLADEIVLGPLGADDTAQLVGAVAPLDDEVASRVAAASNGNPLLAVELAAALGRGEDEPPGSLRSVVRRALAQLQGEALRLAQLLAVAGRDLDRREILALPIASPLDATELVAECALFSTSRGRIGYRHALLRDAAYRDLSEPLRSGLHEAVGVALSSAAAHVAGEAARHLRLSGRDDLALGQLPRAAGHARSVGALDDASAALADAVAIAPDDPALRVELAEVEALRGRADTSDNHFAIAAEGLSDEPQALARAWVRRARWYRSVLINPRRVLAAARRATELLDAVAPEAVAPEAVAPDSAADQQLTKLEALAHWAWAEAVAGDPEAADALLARLQGLLDGQSASDVLTHTVGHARALALVRRGRFRESYPAQIAAAEASQRAGRADLSHGSWLNAASAATCAGDLDRALEFTERGLAAVRGKGLPASEVDLLAGRAHVLARLGRVAEALTTSDEEAEVAESADSPSLVATSCHDRGLLALTLGDAETAERMLADGLSAGSRGSRPQSRLSRAEALARLSRFDDAERELRAVVLEPVGPGDMPDTLAPQMARLQGLIAAGRGDRALAARRLREAAATWRYLVDRTPAGERYVSMLVDFGRPPVVGLVEPEAELAILTAELRELDPV